MQLKTEHGIIPRHDDSVCGISTPSDMRNDETIVVFPPSGLWSGYYLYGHAGPKHRMRLGLIFTADGKISGEGIDDVAPFTINGIFDAMTNQASWTKSYIGMHRVEYYGFYDHQSICGNWTLAMASGGFWIWPDGMKQSEGMRTEIEQPAEEEIWQHSPQPVPTKIRSRVSQSASCKISRR